MNSTANLSEPISAPLKSTPAYIAYASLPSSIFLAILATWACYRFLPQQVADTYVPQIWTACLSSGAGGFLGGVAGTVVGSLQIKAGKIAKQAAEEL